MRGESGREPEPGRPRTCVRGCVRVRVTSNAFLVSPALRAPPVPRRKGPIRFRLASGEDGRRRDRVPDLTVLSWLDQNSSNSASNSKGDRTQVHGTKLWFYTDGCMASFSSEASFIFIRCLAYGPILFLSKAFPSKDSEFWERIPFILQEKDCSVAVEGGVKRGHRKTRSSSISHLPVT
ncbi:large ribosomal subunit protein mL48 isoform X2 [Rattus norvegicus]|uniref:large ribosomal subunit protein mL48 isoform X2 n=1 Tax=Rattus norvegicus TaxID=10116 RepID=UPI002FD87B69